MLKRLLQHFTFQQHLNMNESPSQAVASPDEVAKPRWRPLSRVDRRVAGVLVEKAKTTPDQYPMTINGLINGSNQKSNRDPQMQLEESDIMDSLDRLKAAGAVVEIQGGGRVPKFRHLMYEWLGVDKVELAVMAELLLRGAQTEGELRGRASRMEPIADLNALRTILDALRAKKLVVDLTPPGRGQILSHGLYESEELERLRARCASSGDFEAPSPSSPAVQHRSMAETPSRHTDSADVGSLRAELSQLKHDLEELKSVVERQQSSLDDMRAQLGG
jgi:uncharacterized protein YceH (UPF0502 family)